MFYEYLKEINRVEIYAAIAFFIFFLFFIAIAFHTIRLGKKETEKLSRIPLDDEIDIENTNLN